MKYNKLTDTTWVRPTLGFFPASRLSPSGSGEQYKGSGSRRGYLIVEVDKNGKEKIDQKNIFLTIDELMPILYERRAVIDEEEKNKLEESIKNLPYKNILDLRPLIQDEIKKASEKFGFKSSDDLNVEVTMEEDLDLVVRIGLA